MGTFATGPKILWQVIVRELHQLVSRPIYLFSIVIAPLVSYVFFLSLMAGGLPEELPTAVIDLDHSATSRNLTRQFTTVSSLAVTTEYASFSEAREAMQKGQIFGFVIIPPDFEADLMANRRPELSYYTTNAYLIPGALEYRSFKTTTTLAAAAAVQQTLLARGEYERDILPQIQPITVDMHPLGNPWISYSVYLNNTFLPGVLGVIILLTTIFSIGSEIKHATSREWLRTADDNILLAVTGKLLPQTLLFFIMGAFCLSLLYGYFHFPLQNGIWPMLAAMLLFVTALQGVSIFFVCIAPSLRIALSMGGLFGVVSFSLAGISFPAEAMYPAFHLLTDMLPLRHYFIIYADQALNGVPLYYSRLHYMVLFIYTLLALPFLPLLKRALRRQVYVA